MDKTALVQEVADLFRMNGHAVETSVKINHREIDVVARELQGLIPKTILIECADYGKPTGVEKVQEDYLKLSAARDSLKEAAVLVHVSRNGYTPDAGGWALEKGLSALTFANLSANLVNFSPYIDAMESDRLKPIIMREYQPTTISFETTSDKKSTAIAFFDQWLAGPKTSLIVLGDYGVGKSWLLKRYLYELLDRYRKNRAIAPLPFFIPLQRFTKAFDFQNLILKTFESYGLSGVHYSAFQHLVRTGRVVLLLDSFDEMAQHLGPSVIRENIATIFEATSGASKLIITSRPNYFENRAERILLVERFNSDNLHELDKIVVEEQLKLTGSIEEKLSQTDFARLDDLSSEQRTKLFKLVLGEKPQALAKLTLLLKQYSQLETLSQRAVIARLLTTVAETLAESRTIETIEGQPLLPPDIGKLNQAKIFEIVVHNLLNRDQGIGRLSAGDRYRFLKRFALFLQREGSDFFATPDELRELVRDIFSEHLKRSDTPEQDFENYYRACRRHSGLTTESQFHDASGVIDLPVSETDTDSRVGFSHNSLREYLVAANIADAVRTDLFLWPKLLGISTTDLIRQFVFEISENQSGIREQISAQYLSVTQSRLIDFLFSLLWVFVQQDAKFVSLLGTPPQFRGVDLSIKDLSTMDLSGGAITDCLLQDTNFTKANLTKVDFRGSLLERVRFDQTTLTESDFSHAAVYSIFAYDEFDTETDGILEKRKAEQWLHSHGAKVDRPEELNSLMGQPWYEAAREVTRTIEKRSVGTHQAKSLAKGTPAKYRPLAEEFVEYLIQKGVLVKVTKSEQGDGWVVKLDMQHRGEIAEFSTGGKIGPTLVPFFRKKKLLKE